MKIKALLSVILSLNAFSISIATYNIRNFDHDRRMGRTDYANLKKSLVDLNADLIGVQEIRMTKKFRGLVSSALPGFKTVLSDCGGAHFQHLGFVYNSNKLKLNRFVTDSRTSNPNTSGTSVNDCHLGSRPLAIATFTNLENNKKFIAISTHLKSGNYPSVRIKQLNLIIKVVRNYRKSGYENFVLLGDFNTTNFNKLGNKYRELFFKFAEITQTVNTSKDVGCTSYWYGGIDDGLHYPSHLDHILVSKGLFDNGLNAATLSSHCSAVSCEIVPEFNLGRSYAKISDHCPLKVEL